MGNREIRVCQQTWALLHKNILKKWRMKRETLMEWMNAFLLLLLLYIYPNYHQVNDFSSLNSMDLGRVDSFSGPRFTIAYTPLTNTTQQIMKKVASTSFMTGREVFGMSDEESIKEVTANYHEEIARVIFTDTYSYHLKFVLGKRIPVRKEHRDHTAHCVEINEDIDCQLSIFWKEGFVALQAAINAAIIEVTTNHSVMEKLMSVTGKFMVVHPFIGQGGVTTDFFILFCIIAFSPFSYYASVNVTRERKKMKGLMKMMGLRDLAFWLSWGLLYAGFIFIMALCLALVIKSIQFFVMTDFMIVFTLFLLYGLSTIALAFLMSVLVKKSFLTGQLVFLLTIFWGSLGFTALYRYLPVSLEWILSVFSPFAFMLGMSQMLHLDYDLNSNASPDPSSSNLIIATNFMLAFDTFLYLALTMYFEKILPNEYGHQYPPLFFLKSSFWSPEQKPEHMTLDNVVDSDSSLNDSFEPVSPEFHGKEGIRIRNVTKEYKGKPDKIEALKDLALDIYEGQITAILGHSGAGKSTLLNVLSGLSVPTKGSVTIYNKELSDAAELENILQMVGVCPQSNVQFDFLTVRENLRLFAKIRGILPQEVDQEVNRVLLELEMKNIQDVLAQNLSGGQKRKLSFGIAILGDPQIFLLDEPTAGLDPISRHRVWNLLKERKADRVILFSTQFMDEADILADRKVFLSKGKLKCAGSSLFLKKRWGIGYHLSLQLKEICARENITSLVKQHIPNAKLSAESEGKLVYTLPLETTCRFPELYKDLDNSPGLGIENYGVSMTTLNEVFLKLEGKSAVDELGASIDDFLHSVEHQNIALEVDKSGTGTGVDDPSYNGAIIVSGNEKDYRFSLVCNTKRLNCFPVLMDIVSNGLLGMFAPSARIQTDRSTFPGKIQSNPFEYLGHTIIWLILASSCPPYIAMSSIDDYKSKTWSQLRISGLFPSAYWFGQACVDVPLYCFIFIFMYLMDFALSFQETLFTVVNRIIQIPCAIGYVLSLIFLTYVISFIFRKGRKNSGIWSFCFFVITMFSVAGFLFENYENIPLYCITFLIPPTTLIGCLFISLDLIMLSVFGEGSRRTDPFLVLLIPLLHFFIFLFILRCLEWKFGKKSMRKDPFFRISPRSSDALQNPEQPEWEDEDVQMERVRTTNSLNSTNVDETPVIIASCLRKEYARKRKHCFSKRKNKIATRNISFCVRKGEILGLLGHNGAGKSTSIKVITGDMKPTAGQVLLKGSSEGDPLGFLGYCPQENVLWPNLTVREHLEVFAAVKGLSKGDKEVTITRLVDALKLQDHLKAPVKTLAEGVKRKLCFALSILGNPSVLLLDEPSTGMDPEGQQQMWQAIRATVRNTEGAALLTTHYMAEAEAVCDRVAIMVSGRLRCIGSIQHLKSKFGKDYLLEMKVKTPAQGEPLHEEILKLFPQAARQDRYSSLMVYKLPVEDVRPLAQAFFKLEKVKQNFDLEDYSLSQSTLEQVFLELSKEQELDGFDEELDLSVKWKLLPQEEP
ncbi:ABC-type organic anion transporter ABCA8-like isoform X3 [Dipodomys spectabilis]|uniref:ABC-type organic anion transporter ABCA8-like isoform X3 n=1 Tax=Dipodomys spectabilis TaxID=105255 RepID=UPI001C534AAA|nr:ABC-type organic anion transporter ABCA8-like isoform X3 [Dipodomys spectabilis]